MTRSALLWLLLIPAMPAQAHLVGPAHQEFSWWLVDPVAVALLILVAIAYQRGIRHQRRRHQATPGAFRKRQIMFWGGWATLAIALASPLDPLGEELFAAHMVQHELMMLIAAPLLILARPGAPLLRGLPRWGARGVGVLLRGRGLSRFWNWLASPLVAWLVHLVVLWGWHVPVLFSAGLQNTWIHALQHLSFLWVALLFWWALVRSSKRGSAVGVIYLFTTAIHASVLGALLTFAPSVWYHPYLATAPHWGLSAMEDQQLGGLIMWMPSGLVFIAAALVEVAGYMRNSERRARQRERIKEAQSHASS